MPATMAAWGGAELTVVINDVDYSCWAVDVAVTRTKNRVWDPSEAGTCDVRLELVTGDVAATVGDVGEPVTVTIGYGSLSRRLFTGRVQLRSIEISPRGDVLVLNCVDEFMGLARVNKRAATGDVAVGSGEPVPDRINRWLDEAGSTTVRSLDTSSYTCPATLIDGNTLLQIQVTALADGGDFFVAGDGTLTFKAWAWQITADTAGCMFSDRNLHGWVPYSSARWTNDLDEVQNQVTGTRRPIDTTDVPVPQTVDNPASVTTYGPTGDPLDQLELADDTQVANRVAAVVEVAAYPNPRFDSIIVNPALDPPLMWPQVLPITYSTLVAANRRFADGTDVSRYGHVIGELWRLTPNTAEIEYRCSGTGTWDLLRPPRPPISVEFCPDGSLRVPAGYPCDDTSTVILKSCAGDVIASYPPGSLCECGHVFPTDDTCYVCYFDGTTEVCFDLTPETVDALLWLDALDGVVDREIEKVDGDNPLTDACIGFGGTRFDVISTVDAIDASTDGGLVAESLSDHIGPVGLAGAWTIDFWFYLPASLPGAVLEERNVVVVDLFSVQVILRWVHATTDPTDFAAWWVVNTQVDDTHGYITDPLTTNIPAGVWHRWRFRWSADDTFLSVLMDGVDPP